MIPSPAAFIRSMVRKRCMVSSGVSDAVGSSKMTMRAFIRMARAISTICRLALPRVDT